MSYYILSLNDYEDYSPHTFECDCSQEAFKDAVIQATNHATDELTDKLEEGRLINGWDLLTVVVERLQSFNTFKLIKKDYEISIGGTCFYQKGDERPEVFSDDSWNKVTAHNKRVLNEDEI